jgi:hypothetical protein
MRDLFDEMVDALRDARDFDPIGHMADRRNRGMRLAAYAYFCAHPNEAPVDQLAQTVLSEDKPFNEDMGLEALRIALSGNCHLLPSETRARLRSRAADVRQRAVKKNRESQRAKKIDQILERCPE